MTRRFFVCIVVAALMGGCGEKVRHSLDPKEKEIYQEFLLAQHERYPAARAEDYYKLIYQSLFGARHLGEDEAAARSSLRREIFALGPPRPDESLLENLDPDGRMVRVNLRPFVDRGLSQEDLVAVMMETAGRVVPDTLLLQGRWNAFRDLVEEERLEIAREDVSAVDDYIRKRDYPVLRHSDQYRGAYKPAYRVVLRELFENKYADRR